MERRPPPKTRKGLERREQILDAATRVFATQGTKSVSLASIASLVGITEQGVMHYFPTKVDVLVGVLERRDERDTERFTALFREGLPMLEVLVAVMRGLAEDDHLATLHTVLMAESIDPDHPAHDWFVQRNKRVRQQLEIGLIAAQRSGELRAGLDAHAVASQLMSLMDGLPAQRALAGGELDTVAIFEAYVRQLTPAG
ncbi:MAG: TetR/AcrR family transcriptional regulator [Solirubrobacteraceae bacterium]